MPIAFDSVTGRIIVNAAGTALCENCCPELQTCADVTQARLVISGVVNDPFGCGAGCQGFNDEFVLPFTNFQILGGSPGSGCASLFHPLMDDPDYQCEYSDDFTICGVTYRIDALIAGKFGEGWVALAGIRGPAAGGGQGNYNENQGLVAEECYVWGIDPAFDPAQGAGSGQILDFDGTYAGDNHLCGICGSPQCDWTNASIHMTIEQIP